MIVLIDAGNTRVKLGWVLADGRREASTLALQHGELHTVRDWLQRLPAPCRAAVGVNVAGTAIAQTIAAQLGGSTAQVTWITSQHRVADVRNCYMPVSQLGADRWVSVAGLARKASLAHKAGLADATAAHTPADVRSPPLMLANFGTATTIDTLAPDGKNWVFPGGIIFPGPTLMRSSLAQGTANLPHAAGDTVAYPTHTHQAIATGIAAAQAGAVLRQWLCGLEKYGQAPAVYSAGGGWPEVETETRRLLGAAQARMGLPIVPIEWLATPVLDGLASIALESAFLDAT